MRPVVVASVCDGIVFRPFVFGERPSMSDDWDFHFCQVDNKIASIFVDLGIRKEVPIKDQTDMVYLRLYLRKPREDGLTSDEEYDALNELEEELMLAASSSAATYVGRNTTDGFRDFVFYTSGREGLLSALRKVMAGHPDYTSEEGSQPDPEWQIYREFLYPSPDSFQAMQNRKIYAALEKEGDDLTTPREIDHWIYFDHWAARNRFIEDCRKLGFEPRPSDPKDSAGTFKVQIFRADVPTANTLDPVIRQLMALAQSHGGNYDGWETSLERG